MQLLTFFSQSFAYDGCAEQNTNGSAEACEQIKNKNISPMDKDSKWCSADVINNMVLKSS